MLQVAFWSLIMKLVSHKKLLNFIYQIKKHLGMAEIGFEPMTLEPDSNALPLELLNLTIKHIFMVT